MASDTISRMRCSTVSPLFGSHFNDSDDTLSLSGSDASWLSTTAGVPNTGSTFPPREEANPSATSITVFPNTW